MKKIGTMSHIKIRGLICSKWGNKTIFKTLEAAPTAQGARAAPVEKRKSDHTNFQSNYNSSRSILLGLFAASFLSGTLLFFLLEVSSSLSSWNPLTTFKSIFYLGVNPWICLAVEIVGLFSLWIDSSSLILLNFNFMAIGEAYIVLSSED